MSMSRPRPFDIAGENGMRDEEDRRAIGVHRTRPKPSLAPTGILPRAAVAANCRSSAARRPFRACASRAPARRPGIGSSTVPGSRGRRGTRRDSSATRRRASRANTSATPGRCRYPRRQGRGASTPLFHFRPRWSAEVRLWTWGATRGTHTQQTHKAPIVNRLSDAFVGSPSRRASGATSASPPGRGSGASRP